ncbi:MAG TPA: class I SAM-dependent methyltransferase [Ferruginibacter sp.]|nr:class I SAM-dependent methyltransferase [Ferruginibacter sp.]
MKLKILINKLINKIPFIQYLKFKKNSWAPAGHFYSPLVLIDDIKKREFEIWKDAAKEGIKGIDLRTDEQIKLIKSFTQFYDEIPFKPTKQANIRYQFENGFYSYTDGIILYSMIRHFKPKNIIEIGSGFSSAVMLDTNELFFNNEINLTFIEPYPDRLHSIMTENDKITTTIIQSNVQAVSIDSFEKLRAGDILFIDSTHVAKTGSDVNYILFEILPSLQSGVLIHFHDVFYPFEYPKEWVFEGRSWNEDYFLKAFLMYNDKFEIKLFSEYIHKHHKNAFENMPLSYKNWGGNFWILKK